MMNKRSVLTAQRSSRHLSLLVLSLLLYAPLRAQEAAAPSSPPASPRPRLRIESFAPSRGYAQGTETVLLLGTVRNIGNAPLPPGLVTARIYAISGLEYTEGDTMPRIPALEPDASVTFQWRLKPTSPDAELITALALEAPGETPITQTISIPHFSEPPRRNGAAVVKTPTASAGRYGALIENQKIRARIAYTTSNIPVLFLSARGAGGWRQIGTVSPLASVLSAEGGQIPWWEVFKGEEMLASNRKGEASLLVSGGFGVRWRATFTFTVYYDSAVLDIRLRFAPQRFLKLHGLRCGPFLAGDGSFGAQASETLPPENNGPNCVRAIRWGEVTTGMVWPGAPLFPEWQAAPLPTIAGADYHVLGVEFNTPGLPVRIDPPAQIDTRWRLFVLTPSKTVADALRIPLALQPGRGPAGSSTLASRGPVSPSGTARLMPPAKRKSQAAKKQTTRKYRRASAPERRRSQARKKYRTAEQKRRYRSGRERTSYHRRRNR